MFIVLIAGAVLAALLEYRSWAMRKHYRDIAFSACVLGVGVALGVLRLLRMPAPTPLGAIQTIFKPASRLLEKLLS